MSTLFNKCFNCKATNLVNIDKQQLPATRNCEIMAITLKKCVTCNFFGFVNLTEVNQVVSVHNNFWSGIKPSGCECKCNN